VSFRVQKARPQLPNTEPGLRTLSARLRKDQNGSTAYSASAFLGCQSIRINTRDLLPPQTMPQCCPTVVLPLVG